MNALNQLVIFLIEVLFEKDYVIHYVQFQQSTLQSHVRYILSRGHINHISITYQLRRCEVCRPDLKSRNLGCSHTFSYKNNNSRFPVQHAYHYTTSYAPVTLPQPPGRKITSNFPKRGVKALLICQWPLQLVIIAR